jgi:nitrate reductase gamma subunit
MDYLIFQVFPYIALGVLILGSIARYERDPFTWKSSSSQMLRRKQLILGSVLFHVGVIVVFFGHLIGLLTPIWVFDTLGIVHGFKQVMAIVVGGIAGGAALVGGLLLLHRRLTDPRILATSTIADTTILLILVVQLVLGMATILISMQHLDGGEMVLLMAWAQGIFTFDSDAHLFIEQTHWIIKTHIALGLLIFLLFPFTRLVHMLSVPIRYVAVRKGYQVVRTSRWAPKPAQAIPAVNAALANLVRTLTGKGHVPEQAMAKGSAPGFVGLVLTPVVWALRALDRLAIKMAGDAAKARADERRVQTPAE